MSLDGNYSDKVVHYTLHLEKPF